MTDLTLEPPHSEEDCRTRMARIVVEAIVEKHQVQPTDQIEITDVAIAHSAPKTSFWCRFEIGRESGMVQTGALLAWFLAKELPPVLQFYQQAT